MAVQDFNISSIKNSQIKSFLYFFFSFGQNPYFKLENKIQDILGNWDDYQYIINNAYNRAMKYTTDEFIKEIQ